MIDIENTKQISVLTYYDSVGGCPIHYEEYARQYTKNGIKIHFPPEEQKTHLVSLADQFITHFETVKSCGVECVQKYLGKMNGYCLDARTREAYTYALSLHKPKQFLEHLEDVSKTIVKKEHKSYFFFFAYIVNTLWEKDYSADNYSKHSGVFSKNTFKLIQSFIQDTTGNTPNDDFLLAYKIVKPEHLLTFFEFFLFSGGEKLLDSMGLIPTKLETESKESKSTKIKNPSPLIEDHYNKMIGYYIDQLREISEYDISIISSLVGRANLDNPVFKDKKSVLGKILVKASVLNQTSLKAQITQYFVSPYNNNQKRLIEKNFLTDYESKKELYKYIKEIPATEIIKTLDDLGLESVVIKTKLSNQKDEKKSSDDKQKPSKLGEYILNEIMLTLYEQVESFDENEFMAILPLLRYSSPATCFIFLRKFSFIVEKCKETEIMLDLMTQQLSRMKKEDQDEFKKYIHLSKHIAGSAILNGYSTVLLELMDIQKDLVISKAPLTDIGKRKNWDAAEKVVDKVKKIHDQNEASKNNRLIRPIQIDTSVLEWLLLYAITDNQTKLSQKIIEVIPSLCCTEMITNLDFEDALNLSLLHNESALISSIYHKRQHAEVKQKGVIPPVYYAVLKDAVTLSTLNTLLKEEKIDVNESYKSETPFVLAITNNNNEKAITIARHNSFDAERSCAGLKSNELLISIIADTTRTNTGVANKLLNQIYKQFGYNEFASALIGVEEKASTQLLNSTNLISTICDSLTQEKTLDNYMAWINFTNAKTNSKSKYPTPWTRAIALYKNNQLDLEKWLTFAKNQTSLDPQKTLDSILKADLINFAAQKNDHNDLAELYDFIVNHLAMPIDTPIDSQKNTFLHVAVRIGELRWINQLIKTGNSPHVKNQSGKTPLWLAFEAGKPNLFSALVKESEIEQKQKDTIYSVNDSFSMLTTLNTKDQPKKSFEFMKMLYRTEPVHEEKKTDNTSSKPSEMKFDKEKNAFQKLIDELWKNLYDKKTSDSKTLFVKLQEDYNYLASFSTVMNIILTIHDDKIRNYLFNTLLKDIRPYFDSPSRAREGVTLRLFEANAQITIDKEWTRAKSTIEKIEDKKSKQVLLEMLTRACKNRLYKPKDTLEQIRSSLSAAHSQIQSETALALEKLNDSTEKSMRESEFAFCRHVYATNPDLAMKGIEECLEKIKAQCNLQNKSVNSARK